MTFFAAPLTGYVIGQACSVLALVALPSTTETGHILELDVALLVEWSKAHVFVRTANRLSEVRALFPARTRKWLEVDKKGFPFRLFWLQAGDTYTGWEIQ